MNAVSKKLVLTYLDVPSPFTVDRKTVSTVEVSVSVDTYPAVPNPVTVDRIVETNCAVEMYPNVPNPLIVLSLSSTV